MVDHSDLRRAAGDGQGTQKVEAASRRFAVTRQDAASTLFGTGISLLCPPSQRTKNAASIHAEAGRETVRGGIASAAVGGIGQNAQQQLGAAIDVRLAQ